MPAPVANIPRSAHLAVLIDADNASAKIVEGLFNEIAKLGQASVRRIYGDFSGASLKPWADVLTKYAIIPQQNFASTRGKNASDIALVIDAMDLLHGNRVDGFCLVSSDSDFTRLAARIREYGLEVYGFGEQKTPESLRQACLRFFFTENLAPEMHAAGTNAPVERAPLQPLGDAVLLLRNVVMQMESEDGWYDLSAMKNRLIALVPEFDQRTYGHAKFSDLVIKTGAFDIETPEGRGMRIRLKKKQGGKQRLGEAD